MNNRPIVYVARDITYYDKNNQERKIASYVSRAYLQFKGEYYDTDGSYSKEYIIDYINPCEYAPQNYSENLSVDSNVSISKNNVFDTFGECKAFVKQENTDFMLAIGTTTASKILQKFELHKEALEYAEALEEKYIPFMDRDGKAYIISDEHDDDDIQEM